MASNSKMALITGGSSGLGFAFAKQLIREGWTVLLLARDETKLKRAVAQLDGPGRIFWFAADIRDAASLDKVSQQIRSQFGKIDFLILNAGVVHIKLLHEYTDIKEMKEDLEIDLWGTILSAKIFVPLLVSGSRVLLISSAFGLLGGAGYSIYCAAKAGMINFAESLRRELLSKKISVHVACPPDIDTPQYQREFGHLPNWMKGKAENRGVVLTPEVAARRILKKCQGGTFLITINFGISLFLFLSRILPRGLKDSLLDRMLPRP